MAVKYDTAVSIIFFERAFGMTSVRYSRILVKSVKRFNHAGPFPILFTILRSFSPSLPSSTVKALFRIARNSENGDTKL